MLHIHVLCIVVCAVKYLADSNIEAFLVYRFCEKGRILAREFGKCSITHMTRHIHACKDFSVVI